MNPTIERAAKVLETHDAISGPRKYEDYLADTAAILERELCYSELVEAVKFALADPLDIPHLGIVGACDENCVACRLRAILAKIEGGKS